jgi:pyridoxamine 5'-phosphate oxidase
MTLPWVDLGNRPGQGEDQGVTADTARLQQTRAEYQQAELIVADDWLTQFRGWLAEAEAANLSEPNAMVLSTVANEQPSSRTVLLKGLSVDGFVFYTNYQSRKATEIAGNPAVSLLFPWYALARQVVVTGQVEKVPRSVTEQYFAARPRESQIGAWASPQSTVVPDRATLDLAWAAAAQRFPDEVPAPPHWGGYLVRPATVEFWQGRVGRLHDRLRYRVDTGAVERLAP